MNRFQLKVLMLLLMLVDHIGWFIPNAPLVFNYIGRVVAPVFVFLLVDGFFHTGDKYDYAKRLMLAAGVMTAGNLLISMLFPGIDVSLDPFMYAISIVIIVLLGIFIWLVHKASAYHMKRILFMGIILALTPFLFSDIFRLTNNIFLPFALGLMILNTIEYGRDSIDKTYNLFTVLGILFITAFTEGSLVIPFMILIFYYLRNNTKMLIFFYTLLSLLFAVIDFSYHGLFIENYQWMMIFALPFFFLYNGKKGRDFRYLFYGFYPLHIWILYIIGFFITKLGGIK